MHFLKAFLAIGFSIGVYGAFAQTINRIEYFVDNDPGFGSGTAVSFTPATTISDLPLAIDVSPLGTGFHNLYLRSQDNLGRWSMTNRWLFVKDLFPAATVNKAEYFIDNDPGFGNGTDVPVTPSANIAGLVIPVNASSTGYGFHTIYVRSRDNNNNWSVTNRWAFVNDLSPAADITKLEYFIDTDPGYGNATPITVSPAANIADLTIPINITAMPYGFHTIYIRSLDNNSQWSLTNRWVFVKEPVQSNLQAGEYFFDTDPGIGNGTAFSLGASPGTETNDLVFGANVTALTQGTHTLFVRTRDVNGSWSLTNAITFDKLTNLPVDLTRFTATPKGKEIVLNWQTASESNNRHFEIERSATGNNFTVLATVPGSGNSSVLKSYQYIDLSPLKGANYYRLKQVDIDGQFNYSAIRKVDMQKAGVLLVLQQSPGSADLVVRTLSGNGMIRLFDASGKKIKDVPIAGNYTNIDISRLSAGTYLVVLQQKEQVVAVERFVVAR